MNTVLVTGATGFIGKRLVQQLLQKKIAVRVLIRSIQKSAEFPIEVECVVGDLIDPSSLKNSCAGIDTVFHLGGYAHAWDDSQPSVAEQHNKVNFQGTQHVLLEAVKANVKRFIYFSSVKAVAESSDCINEEWDKQPDSSYGIAKRTSEALVLDAGKNNNMHVSVLRPALVYGPGWKGNLASMLRAIDRGFFLPLPETNNSRSLVSVEDICYAAILAANSSEANGKIYFVTDGIYYSTRQLYVLLSRALAKRVPSWHMPLWFFKFLARVGDIGKKIMGRRLPFDSEALTKLFGSAKYDSQRIQRDLGFKPAYDLEKMLPDIVDAYRKPIHKEV